MTEIERTFLVRSLPQGLSSAEYVDIVDVYFPIEATHPTLRLRSRGDRFELTKKTPVSGDDDSMQHEATIPLTAEEYRAFAAMPGKRIEKRRYFLRDGGHEYEVSVFGGALRGLVMADVEFSSAEARDAFEPADFCAAEVTDDEAFAGGMLAGKSIEAIAPALASHGYAPASAAGVE